MTNREEAVAEIARRVEAALADGLHRHLDLFPVKWVTVFEYMDTEGDRGIASLASPGLMKWDVTGLLTEILHYDAADTIRNMINGGDDE